MTPAATPAPPPKRIRAERTVTIPVREPGITIGQRLRVCVYLPGGALAETTLTARLVRRVAR